MISSLADAAILYIIVDSSDDASSTLNQDLEKIDSWADKWLVSFNPQKTESILLVVQSVNPPLNINNKDIADVESQRHLSVTFESC